MMCILTSGDDHFLDPMCCSLFCLSIHNLSSCKYFLVLHSKTLLHEKLILQNFAFLFTGDQVNLHGFASDPDDVRVEEWQAVSALAQVVRRYPLVAELLAPSKDERPVMSWSPKGGSLAIVGKEQFICCRIGFQ